MVRAVLTRHSIWETPVSKPVNRDGQWLTDPRVAAFARDSDVRFNLGMVSGQLGRSFLSSSFGKDVSEYLLWVKSQRAQYHFAVMLWLFLFLRAEQIFKIDCSWRQLKTSGRWFRYSTICLARGTGHERVEVSL